MSEEEKEEQNPDNEPEMTAKEYINQIKDLKEKTVSREEYERIKMIIKSLQRLLSTEQVQIFRE